MIFLTCSVNYTGNWAPEMIWQEYKGKVITTGIVSNAIADQVSCRLAILATKNINGNKYVCLTYFGSSNKPQNTTAINVPAYRYEWMSQEIVVEGCETGKFLNEHGTKNSSTLVYAYLMAARQIFHDTNLTIISTNILNENSDSANFVLF